MNRANKSRFARRAFRLGAIGVALLTVASIAGVFAAASPDSSASPIAAEDEAQIREVLDDYFGLDDFSASAAALQGEGLSQAAIDDAEYDRNATLDAIATARFADAQKKIETMAGFVNEYLRVRGVQVLKAEHEIRDLDFVTMADVGGAVYRVAVWYGDQRGVWDAKSAGYELVSRVDTVPVYDVTLIKKDGVWRLDAVDQVVRSEDGSAADYGPFTAHESVTTE